MSGGQQSASQGAGTSGSDDPGRRLAAGWRRVRRSLAPALRAHFGIDVRALAAFRIALGAILLADLALRARYLRTFYTDAGVYPRSAMADLYPVAEQLSIHGQFASLEAQAALFVLAAVAAIALLAGYRTTLATAVSLALLLSLHGRNPLVLNGGDILLRHLLLWSVFLPLGERWAVDARRRDREARERVTSVATAGLLLQVVVVYAVNAVLKHGGTDWAEGTAIHYVFGLDQFTVLLGDALAQYPALLDVFGRLWLWMLTVSVLLVVFRGWLRAAFAGLFAGAHATMGLTMQLGLFPLVSIAALLVFLPAPVWDRVERRVAAPIAARLPAGLGRRQSAVLADAGMADRLAGPLRRGYAVWRSYVVPGVAALLLAGMLVSNAGSVADGGMGPLEVTDLTDGDPRWSMFAPNPLSSGHWYVAVGTTESGERVDALRGGTATLERPDDLADTVPTARWRKYLSHVRDHVQEETLQRNLADYACRRDDGARDDPVESVTVVHMTEHVDIDGQNRITREDLVTYTCR